MRRCDVVAAHGFVPSRSALSRAAQHRNVGLVVRAEHSGRRASDHARDGRGFIGGGRSAEWR